jgi:hypothetical protein
MKVTIKSPRANKKKLVVPFAGEENFIVPMQGAFGQPDHEEYISVDNKFANLIDTSSPAPSPTDTTQTGEGLPTGSTSIENPNYNTSTGGIRGAITSSSTTSTSTQFPSGGTVDTTTITPELTNPVSNTPTPSGTVIDETVRNPILTNQTLGSGTSTSGTTNPPRTSSGVANESATPLPTFPDFSTLDCSALQSEISRIQFVISGGGFTTQLATAYNNALATAKNTYTSKCNTPSPSPSPIIIAPLPAIPIGGGFGGGIGGGGFGEPPADETNITEQTTTQSGGLSWFWIAVGLTGLYFLIV